MQAFVSKYAEAGKTISTAKARSFVASLSDEEGQGGAEEPQKEQDDIESTDETEQAVKPKLPAYLSRNEIIASIESAKAGDFLPIRNVLVSNTGLLAEKLSPEMLANLCGLLKLINEGADVDGLLDDLDNAASGSAS